MSVFPGWTLEPSIQFLCSRGRFAYETPLEIFIDIFGKVTPPGPDVGAPGSEGLGIPLHVYCGASGFAFILR